jgi:hypothetical protein
MTPENTSNLPPENGPASGEIMRFRMPSRAEAKKPIEPVVDVEAVIKEYQMAVEGMTPAEKGELFQKLQRAAEGGVAVQALQYGRRDQSDLDGNMAVYLLRKLRVIKNDTPMYYVKHEDINNGKIDKHPEVKLFLDIAPTPESIATALKYANDLEGKKHKLEERTAKVAARIGATADILKALNAEERVYFEHHGPSFTQESGSTTLKVYALLRALGKMPAPDDPDPRQTELGKMLLNIVAFVNAQDLKNYYKPEGFDIEQTAMNAFGWIQAPVINPDGTLYRNPQKPTEGDYWGRYDPQRKDSYGALVGYREEFIKIMMRTGDDPTKQLTFDQMRSFGISNPELVVSKIKENIAKARETIKRLRAQKLIVPIEGTEVFFDTRRLIETTAPDGTKEKRPAPGELNKLGVDFSDILMSEGVPNRIIIGVDKDDNIESITAFVHDDKLRGKIIQLVSLKLAGTTEQIRNFIRWGEE